MLPDVIATLRQVQSRSRWRSVLLSIAAGGAGFAAASVPGTGVSIALGIASVGAVTALAMRPRLSLVNAARLVESVEPHHNLLVTAAENVERPRSVRAEFRDAIHAQATARAATTDVARVVPLRQPALVALMVLAGCLAIARVPPSAIALPGSADRPEKKGPGLFSVRVSPPAYTRANAYVVENPVQVTVISGSRVEISAADGRLIKDWIATEATGLDLEIIPGPFPPKFLSVLVLPDAPPQVRVVAPGKDTAFAEPAGSVPIRVESRDDLGLTSLTLRLTKASGGGENVTFTDSDVPLQLSRTSDREWSGQARLDLAALGLSDGDIVVYRAVSRDTNPRGSPVHSDQYVIEIGKSAELADAGFALPADERKYAISQQMVVYKTERLLERARTERAFRSSGAWLEESRGIAIEQRMVRAEVVFLGGGEVQDEVEEAAHSHELAEGRLENTGRIEMLRAINAMSRAEAQLNDGRVDEALVFERQALASLQRALDRRRYFLRTLPDRSRIDTTRRLSGDRRDARSWTREDAIAQPPGIEAHRALMRELAAALHDNRSLTSLAARVAGLDAASAALQRAAVSVATASGERDRQVAVTAAMDAISAHALTTLPSSTPVAVPRSSLRGRLADELKSTRLKQ